MGKLAEQKATDPAIQEFVRWMVTDHEFLNRRLRAVAHEGLPFLQAHPKEARILSQAPAATGSSSPPSQSPQRGEK